MSNSRVFRFTSSPWGFRFYDWNRYCAFMSSIGIRDVCGMFVNPKELQLSFRDDLTDAEIGQLKAIATDNGVRVVEVAGGGDYTVKMGIDAQVELTKKHIDLAAKLGVEIFRLFAGWCSPSDITDATYRQVIDSLTEIGKYASRFDMTVVMENHGGITATAEQCHRILSGVNLRNVGLNYDPANFLYYGEDPVKALDRLLPYVLFTHFKDCAVRDGVPKYCRVGQGDIEYGAILSILLPVYNGFIGLEYENEHDVERGTQDDMAALKALLIQAQTA
jgi:sugar phosphate isomerase/epimerase